MTPTPVDHAELQRNRMRDRLTASLAGLKPDLEHSDDDARWAAWSCHLLLVGAITDSSVTAFQAWTYVRGHISQCHRDTNRTEAAQTIYARVLDTLNGK